jgi:hypothetical protein
VLRLFVFVGTLLVLALPGPVALLAQDGAAGASGSPLERLGYPELRITVTDDGVELPSEVAAGRYLVVLDNATPDDVEVSLILPPNGLTGDDLQATPAAEDMPPAWFYEASIAGGVAAGPGGIARSVLELAPAGGWVVDVQRYPAEDASAATPPADVDERSLLPSAVSGDATPGAEAEPMVDAVTMLQDFAFAIRTDLPTGPQVWQVTNTGTQPHHLVLFRVPGPIDDDQVIERLEIEFGLRGEDATPTADMPAWAMDPGAFEQVAYAPVLSAGRSEWVAMDLTPGTYVAVCFVPDRATGMPHALMGMVAVFSVAERPALEGGTPTP